MLSDDLDNPFRPNLDEIDTKAKPTRAVHVRVRQRTNRTYITTIEGIHDDIDFKKVCSCLKKQLKCSGAVLVNEDKKSVIQLTGDQREPLKKFLMEEGLAEHVITHGF
jgi:translation initiation factor SUI1